MEAKTIYNFLYQEGDKLRGSVYYQTSVLAQTIFQEGTKKENRVDPQNDHFQKIASYNTMTTYRNVWNNFFNYLKEHWHIKNCEAIGSDHVLAYIEYKIENYPSKQYLEKICSAIGKLETALKVFTFKTYGVEKSYDFSIRHEILNESRDLKLVANNYHNRAYKEPLKLIAKLSNQKHRLAATIQYQSGTRIEGVALIKQNQLHGFLYDPITNTTKGIIFTKEKGGYEGNVFVNIDTYIELKRYIHQNKIFKLKRVKYSEEIRKAADLLSIQADGSHGLRWNFAKRRLFEYAKAGYTYQESLQRVSHEMKHNRADITEHYLGG